MLEIVDYRHLALSKSTGRVKLNGCGPILDTVLLIYIYVRST